ncbi:MAG: GNAT family N-acetyltransferase, partial [Propionibacteriales bacterium]|nr:GNAT family N-acetyltransferase [Propionibacteriales bacterium]
MNTALLEQLDRYYDAAPRGRARTEEVGPFTLFVATSGWPYYARPSRARPRAATLDDVRRVLARQRELGVPLAIEWVQKRAPSLAEVVETAGMRVQRCPLLVLSGMPLGVAGSARIIGTDDVDILVASRAAVSVGFANGGTLVGPEGIEARDAVASTSAQVDDTLTAQIAAGDIRVGAVFAPQTPDVGPVGGGSYTPVGEVAEIAGVAVLPAYRRRGLAAQLAHALAADALHRGVTTVFCSAQSD